MANDILTVDGVTYPVNIIKFEEKSEFVDKFAERTESWDLQRQLAGIFFNYELTLGQIQNPAIMLDLWAKIHEFTEFHIIRLPHDDGLQTFTAYMTTAGRPLLKRINGVNTWGGMTIKFIAKAPQITG